jgi:hypothetical protein
MKELAIVICLACLVTPQNATAGIGFPWLFHTRPKPVLLDQAPPAKPARTSHSVAWHGTEVYPVPSTKQTKARPSDTAHTFRAILKK